MTTQNLRREARIEARVPVVVIRGRTAISLETSDVSFKGLFLETGEALALRSLVRLRVALPSRTIEAHAMVVHVLGEGDGRVPGVGLQFWGLAGPDRTAWDDHVRALIQARRDAVKKAAAASADAPPTSRHPASLEMATPSGIRVTAAPPSPGRTSSK